MKRLMLRFREGTLIRACKAGSDGDVTLQQMRELRTQVPLLYALLFVNAAGVGYTHWGLAPDWLSWGILTVLAPICALRAVRWLRTDVDAMLPADAVRQLRLTTILTVAIAAAFVAWALMLDPYGGPYERAHVANFVAITVIGCIFCLMHLPAAALSLVLIVTTPYVIYYSASENAVLTAIALNFAAVMIVLSRVLLTNFEAFRALVQSKASLASKQAETERLSDENARLAHTDSLTGLPNRRYFFSRLDETIEACRQRESDFALCIFDLDRFKPINDTYGHIVGDRVLAEAGRRLAGFAEDGVTAARLGGDEFGVIVREPVSRSELLSLCARIRKALAEPIAVGEQPIATGCSGGVALYPEAGLDASALFDRADYALYHSKECKRGSVTLFSPEHEDAIRSELAIETALQMADLEAEMTIHFQPIVDLDTGRTVTVEALARWENPLLGRVPPDRFIAAAERGGLIHKVTLLLLRKALGGLHELPEDVGLSFNLSSHDLTSPETVLAVMASVRASGIVPSRVTLELTETALLRDFDLAERSIQALRALGMTVALDDFGTGYSSLGYVHRLPLDKIKIDRSFMAAIEERSGQSIIATVLNLCRNLQVDCIAEGVETPEQAAALRHLGCDLAQGYLFGAPAAVGIMAGRLHGERAQAARSA